MKKMYIAILDEAPDYMVPTLVAHSMINAHKNFECYEAYEDWLENSYRKVTLRVTRKEFDKIADTLLCWGGHENTICGGAPSCLVIMPMEGDKVPNVLKFAKLWAPKQ